MIFETEIYNPCDKGGPKKFEEFVCWVTHYKFCNNHRRIYQCLLKFPNNRNFYLFPTFLPCSWRGEVLVAKHSVTNAFDYICWTIDQDTGVRKQVHIFYEWTDQPRIRIICTYYSLMHLTWCFQLFISGSVKTCWTISFDELFVLFFSRVNLQKIDRIKGSFESAHGWIFHCLSLWKQVLMQNRSYENEFDLHENEPVDRSH